MIATLPETAGFWASIATLWGAPGAWLTYYGTVLRSRDERDTALRTLLSGLKAELAVVSDWAGGAQGGKGYEQRQFSELKQEHPDWFNPGRLIFSFDCPIIHGITNSLFVRELEPILDPVVRLSRSITRLLDYYDEYRTYVNARPALYDSVAKELQFASIRRTHDFTKEQRDFLSQVFRFNAQIHQDLIGGSEGSELGLHKAFRVAEDSISQFTRNLKKPPFPWWYWILHMIAAGAFIEGLFLVLRWIGIL
jgi:hypothetical protein